MLDITLLVLFPQITTALKQEILTTILRVPLGAIFPAPCSLQKAPVQLRSRLSAVGPTTASRLKLKSRLRPRRVRRTLRRPFSRATLMTFPSSSIVVVPRTCGLQVLGKITRRWPSPVRLNRPQANTPGATFCICMASTRPLSCLRLIQALKALTSRATPLGLLGSRVSRILPIRVAAAQALAPMERTGSGPVTFLTSCVTVGLGPSFVASNSFVRVGQSSDRRVRSTLVTTLL